MYKHRPNGNRKTPFHKCAVLPVRMEVWRTVPTRVALDFVRVCCRAAPNAATSVKDKGAAPGRSLQSLEGEVAARSALERSRLKRSPHYAVRGDRAFWNGETLFPADPDCPLPHLRRCCRGERFRL